MRVIIYYICFLAINCGANEEFSETAVSNTCQNPEAAKDEMGSRGCACKEGIYSFFIE